MPVVLSPCSAAKSCPALCDPRSCSTSALPVLRCFRILILRRGGWQPIIFMLLSYRDFVWWAVKCLHSCGKEGANESAGMQPLWLTWKRVSLYVGNSFVFSIRVECCGESKLCALYFGAPMLLCFSTLNKVKLKNACPSTSIGAVRNRTWAECSF